MACDYLDCDYRKAECSNTGLEIGGKWYCVNHLPKPSADQKMMIEFILGMPPHNAFHFWQKCMSYAQQFPDVEFWSVVASVYFSFPDYAKTL